MPSTPTQIANLTQLLEEHHLVVLSDDAMARRTLAESMLRHLAGQSGTEVCRIDGSTVHDARQAAASVLQIVAPRRRLTPDVGGVVEALRQVRAGVRYRYIVWSEAGEMLERDVDGFSELVNAMFAVAVEHEHLSPEPLVLQRVIFTGGAKLGAYAEEEHGQFRRWRLRGSGADLGAATEIVTRPPVLTYRLDG